MKLELRPHQKSALKKLKNGSILCGTVGSGKSITAIAYFCLENGYDPSIPNFKRLKTVPQNLYIITTARKRDTKEWEKEISPFFIFYEGNVVIDSWNNIRKYSDIKDSFFIFDEQRVVGNGVWVKSFLKITKSNKWILLSATPGDTWSDYIPVFIANGFYKNRTEFRQNHIIYANYTSFPKISRYINEGKLIRLKDSILVSMDFERERRAHHISIFVEYDILEYKQAGRVRWNPFTNEPLVNAAALCYLWRRIVNSDKSRVKELLDILKDHSKLIVFYNFNYELDILKGIDYGSDVTIAEWNGHEHQPIPNTESWIYLVQYAAGSEGWNCIETDTIIFFSQNYSYKTMTQAAGRIDRINSPFKDLYFYYFKSHAPIDMAIAKALKSKKNFNENTFVKRNI